jgi:hypothetical protein
VKTTDSQKENLIVRRVLFIFAQRLDQEHRPAARRVISKVS